MPVTLTNSVDIIANSIGLLLPDGINDIANNLQGLEAALDNKPNNEDVYMKSATYSASEVEGRFANKTECLRNCRRQLYSPFDQW